MKYIRPVAVPILIGLAAVAVSPVAADDPSVAIAGRLHLDAAVYDEDVTPFDNGVLVRRARFGAAGDLVDGWSYKLEWDFAEDGVAARDIYVSYRGLGPGQVRVGQFKVPFGLNELTSSNHITFIERSLGTEAFADAFRLGASYEHFADAFGYQAMVYSRRTGTDSVGDAPLGVAGRAVVNPLAGDDNLLHFGVSAAWESTDDADQVRFRTRPEVRAGGAPRLVDTGVIGNADSTLKMGLEVAWLSGPLSVEGEYMRTDVSRGGGAPNVDFDAWHVQGSYVLGGARGYRGGQFRGVTPGATEIALRVSRIDLDDGPIAGGEQNNVTLALNYYASPNVRFMANVVRIDQEDTGETPWAFALRGQMNF